MCVVEPCDIFHKVLHYAIGPCAHVRGASHGNKPWLMQCATAIIIMRRVIIMISVNRFDMGVRCSAGACLVGVVQKFIRGYGPLVLRRRL